MIIIVATLLTVVVVDISRLLLLMLSIHISHLITIGSISKFKTIIIAA